MYRCLTMRQTSRMLQSACGGILWVVGGDEGTVSHLSPHVTHRTHPAGARARHMLVMFIRNKGPRDDYRNYLAICLLCHSYKLMSVIVARRLMTTLDGHLPFTLVQRALVLEDYAPALGVGGGLLVGKRVQEVWEKKRKKGKIIIINKKLTGSVGVNSRLGLGSLVRNI